MRTKKKRKKQKRKLKIGNIIICLIILTLIILAIAFAITKLTGSKEGTKPSDKIAEIKKNITKDKTQKYELTLAMVGDHLIHNGVYNEASKNAGGNGYDFKPMVSYIKEIVQNYDLAYYNQETILGGAELGLSSYPQFLSPYEAGDAMLDAGFNLVSLASNHTMDRYYSTNGKSIENSINYWGNTSDVLYAGSYTSPEQRDEVKIMEKNHIKYTMLSYTYGTNGIPVPNGKDYLVNVWPTDIDNINDPATDTKYQAYKQKVKEDIDKVRDKVDLLMVAMHWGVEYTHTPTKYQEDMAQFLADNGVDIIIGAHPHVIMPITYIDDTLVYFSLGNFLSGQEISDYYNKMVGLLGSAKITKTVSKGETTLKVESTDNQLIYTYHNGYNYNNYKVVPFSNKDIANYLPNYTEVYNHYKEIVTRLNDTITVKPLS